MSKSKEIRLLNDRLDYYTMEVEDDQFDAEEVIRILKRLDELEPLPEPDMRKGQKLIDNRPTTRYNVTNLMELGV